MRHAERNQLEERLLYIPPTNRDANVAESMLQRVGILAFPCESITALCDELERGASAVLIPEEALLQDDRVRLLIWIQQQPSWSDLPLLVIARSGADSAAVAQAVELLGNVTVLERPIRVAALLSAVQSALRARRRQYQIRAHLAQIERDERKLRELYEALKEGDRRKDEFLAILAHELRNPLAPVRNSVHILRLTAANDPQMEHLAAMMERQVNHMVRLVDDLMEVSRITRGKIELRREQIEVAAVVRSAVETSRPLIDAARHRLSVSIPPEPLTLEGDPVRLAQVISNLLNNAAKYTEEGGRIWLTVRREGQEIVIAVKDSGLGIPATALPHIFKLFTQVDRSTARGQGGLGIGLTLVRQLVELHGGRVDAFSEGADQGSEFIVRLPLLRAGEVIPPHSEPAHRKLSGLPPRQVLVVDDNRDAAESLALLLRALGAEVEVAYSGAEALQLLQHTRFTPVLLDIGMPGMDGCEVAERIRQNPALKEVTLIALTGWGQETDRLRSQSAGFDYHLIKPADVTALEDLIVSLDAGKSTESYPH